MPPTHHGCVSLYKRRLGRRFCCRRLEETDRPAAATAASCRLLSTWKHKATTLNTQKTSSRTSRADTAFPRCGSVYQQEHVTQRQLDGSCFKGQEDDRPAALLVQILSSCSEALLPPVMRQHAINCALHGRQQHHCLIKCPLKRVSIPKNDPLDRGK